MARVSPQLAHRPAEVVVPDSPGDEVVLAWSISRSAARACGLAADGAGPPVLLEVLVSGPRSGSARVEARVRDADRTIPLEASPRCGTWIEDSMRGVRHLDIDGLLKLTIRLTAEGVEALYARTDLLAHAGIAGGRYEFEGATLRRIDSAV